MKKDLPAVTKPSWLSPRFGNRREQIFANLFRPRWRAEARQTMCHPFSAAATGKKSRLHRVRFFIDRPENATRRAGLFSAATTGRAARRDLLSRRPRLLVAGVGCGRPFRRLGPARRGTPPRARTVARSPARVPRRSSPNGRELALAGLSSERAPRSAVRARARRREESQSPSDSKRDRIVAMVKPSASPAAPMLSRSRRRGAPPARPGARSRAGFTSRASSPPRAPRRRRGTRRAASRR